jgi:hypothetical protein
MIWELPKEERTREELLVQIKQILLGPVDNDEFLNALYDTHQVMLTGADIVVMSVTASSMAASRRCSIVQPSPLKELAQAIFMETRRHR